MKKTRILSLLLACAMMAGMLAACGSDSTTTGDSDITGDTTNTTTDAFNMSLCIASEPQTIDPALNSAVDGAIMVQHMFEGLMKWSDSGEAADANINLAEIVTGQAESYEKVANEDGTVTYTFTLRDDILWSDGEPVTAYDFEYSWQRLATPATAADYAYMIDMVVGYDVVSTGEADPSELAAVALDDKTFEVTIINDTAYFLEICAFPATFPVRSDIIEEYGDAWTFSPETYVSNGPYILTDWTNNASITMAQNEHYYGVEDLGPETITFYLMDDANAMLTAYNAQDLYFINDVPVDETMSLLASGNLSITDYVGTYYVSYNVEDEIFSDWRVRKAFTLAIDSLYIVENVTQAGQIPAGGFVPAGISDAQVGGDDFRTTGGDYWDVAWDDATYEANLVEANRLLDEAGYEDRSTFPVVEYLYNTSDSHMAIAEALQFMWKDGLGVDISLVNQDWSVFLESRKSGDYQIARNGWIADYDDPISFLDMWITDGGNNDAQYSSEEYDAAIAAAKATDDAEERMAYLHQAEDILMGQDWVLGSIYYYTQPYMLNDAVDGVYYTPLGYFFFGYTTGN